MGEKTPANSSVNKERKLRAVPYPESVFGGVCGGVAYFLGAPVWFIRLVWAFIVLAYGIGVLLYVLLWIFMPKWEEVPEDYDTVTSD